MRKLIAQLAAILLVFAAAITGCKKTNDIAASTGSISGKYTPAGAAARVIAEKAGGTPIELQLGNTDAFGIPDLAPGNYLVQLLPMPGFIAPDPVAVAVVAGSNVDIGTMVLQPAVLDTATVGSISGKISPAGTGTTITVKDAAGNARYWATPGANGDFNISGVNPGPYELNFVTPILFSTPANVKATVAAGKNTDVGTIAVNPAGNKAIDTISDMVYLSNPADATAFIARAANDSAIVLLASFYAYREALSPELLAAMNKIMVAKSIFQVTGATGTFTLGGLKEAAQLTVAYGSGLTKLNLPALRTATIIIRYCPTLTDISTPALETLRSLTLLDTGLKDLTAFQSASFKPSTFEVRSNPNLTSLAGLHFDTEDISECTISGNPLLTNLDGLQAIKRFTRDITITTNAKLQSLTGLENAVYARRLTISSNPQLTNICPAKDLLIYLKNAPTFEEYTTSPTGIRIKQIRQPLVASANGSYATKDDLLAAAALCP